MYGMTNTIRVFLSHKSEDEHAAKAAAIRLQHRGLHVYLDVIDPHLDGEDGPQLGDYIRGRLSECTQLLAMVSAATERSWWVPWEIGVATEKNYPLATYALQPTSLPSFLRKWPVLIRPEHLDLYAEESKKIPQRLSETARFKTMGEARRDTTGDFHRILKQRIG